MALDERGCTWDGPGLVSSLPTFGPRLFGHHAPRVVNTAGWARSLFRRQFTRNGTLCPLGGLRNPLWAPHSWRLVDFGMPILALRLLPRFHLLSAWTHLRGGVCSAWASPWSPRCWCAPTLGSFLMDECVHAGINDGPHTERAAVRIGSMGAPLFLDRVVTGGLGVASLGHLLMVVNPQTAGDPLSIECLGV